MVFFIFSSWGLWCSRNDLFHSGWSTSLLCLLAHTRELVLEYQRAITLNFSHVPETGVVRRWSPPNGTFVKLNVYGAINFLFGFRGLGVVIRDGMGDLLLAVSKGLHGMFSPKAIEIYAAILGLKIASPMRHHTLI